MWIQSGLLFLWQWRAYGLRGPRVGVLPETLFGTGGLVNRVTTPGFNCEYGASGVGNCYFENRTSPIVVPVTGMIAK